MARLNVHYSYYVLVRISYACIATFQIKRNFDLLMSKGSNYQNSEKRDVYTLLNIKLQKDIYLRHNDVIFNIHTLVFRLELNIILLRSSGFV